MPIEVSIPKNLSEPDFGPLGKPTYRRSYSRTKPDGTTETWAETVKRVVEGSVNRVPEKYIEPYEPVKLFHLLYGLKALPAGRFLWAEGTLKNECVVNCHLAHYELNDFSRHFCYLFARLLEGGGVGASYSNRHIRDFEPVPKSLKVHLVCDEDHLDYDDLEPLLSDEYSPDYWGNIEVRDSREGWVEALEILLEAYYNGLESPLVFDVSQIRQKGARLKTFGGVASGPFALARLLHATAEIMNGYEGEKPDSFLFMDIDHEVSKAVVAGGNRRSARISTKYWNDRDIFEFIRCKDDPDAHWSTNISVEIDRKFWEALREGDEKATAILHEVAAGMKKNGEPGFINLTRMTEDEVATPVGVNPCAELILSPWTGCILGNVNLNKFHNDIPGAKEAFRLMARFLLRATFSDFADPQLKENMQRERKIGVGFFGFHDFLIRNGCKYSDFPHDAAMKDQFAEFYDEVREAAREYAFQLRIPEPTTVTCCPPCGSTSQLPGETPGIHPHFFIHYIRRVRFSTLDVGKKAALKKYESMGYTVEDDLVSPNTKIVEFPMRAGIFDHRVDPELVEDTTDLSLEDFLGVQKALQEVYTDSGVSATVNLDPDTDIERIKHAIRTYLPDLKGMTLMPHQSDRKQMPFEPITREEYEAYPEELRDIGAIDMSCPNGACEFDPSQIKLE